MRQLLLLKLALFAILFGFGQATGYL